MWNCLRNLCSGFVIMTLPTICLNKKSLKYIEKKIARVSYRCVDFLCAYQNLFFIFSFFRTFIAIARDFLKMAKTKIIFDTDMGADDAWALITLLKCEEKCNLDVKAITIVAGNTGRDHAAQNTLLVLKTLKREVKVYAGAKDGLLIRPDLGVHYHGEDGFQDLFKPEEKPSLDLLQKEHAVEAMKNLIEEVRNQGMNIL